MCGIAGFIDYRPGSRERAAAVLNDMTEAVAHRGPDGAGIWLDSECRVGLGHRRLSIIDLSELGSQPMHSASGRYSIVFNGEIYGFLELRRELISLGINFRGHSDTEALLAAVETFGIEGALKKCSGMFAFAVFDQKKRTVTFARDRIGKKPVYIGLSRNSIVFGSELKSLRRHPALLTPSLNIGAVALYARHKYIPSPHTVYSEVIKLPPGSILEVAVDRCPPSIDALLSSIVRYWDVLVVAERAIAARTHDETAALRSLEDMLRTAVNDRMVSDVPVGAFLSGGIDSSLVAAMMQELSPAPIRTFTVRFLEEAFNEADVASEVARHLQTDHTEITATAQMALDTVCDLADVYDEPFADPSQIPTLLVSRLAREHVSVALSGDGGDELFGGYARYPQMLLMDRLASKLPSATFRAVSAAPVGLLDGLVGVARQLYPRLDSEVTGDRMKKLAELAMIPDFDQRYLSFVSEWKDPSGLVIGGHEPSTAMSVPRYPAGADRVDRMMFKDTVAYLPDDILTKVDRASMSVGLELRAPLLDYRLIEEAWRAPRGLCLSGGQGKVALRKLLLQRLPRTIVDRPKRGFGVPMNEWLRGPLRPLAEEFFSAARLRNGGVFQIEIVRQRWGEHISRRRNWGTQLWSVLMFNAWQSRWMGMPERMPQRVLERAGAST